jgi:hypothetical protein
MLITAVLAPNGNLLEFTQRGDRWISYLEERRANGDDMIAEFRKRQNTSL